MNHPYSATDYLERKKEQHLEAEARGAIQAPKKQGFSKPRDCPHRSLQPVYD